MPAQVCLCRNLRQSVTGSLLIRDFIAAVALDVRAQSVVGLCSFVALKLVGFDALISFRPDCPLHPTNWHEDCPGDGGNNPRCCCDS